MIDCHPGQCRNCMLRRDVYPASRTGGGTYRRPPRRIRSSICGGCAVDLLQYVTPGHSNVGSWHWDVYDIKALAAAVIGCEFSWGTDVDVDGMVLVCSTHNDLAMPDVYEHRDHVGFCKVAWSYVEVGQVVPA